MKTFQLCNSTYQADKGRFELFSCGYEQVRGNVRNPNYISIFGIVLYFCIYL